MWNESVPRSKHMKRLPCLGHGCSKILLTTPERRMCNDCKQPKGQWDVAQGGLDYQPTFVKAKSTRGPHE